MSDEGTMSQQEMLAQAEAFVKEQLARDSSGHDWWHIARVRRLARIIAREEGADLLVCELAALLHDVADDKIAGDEETGLRTVRGWLESHGVESDVVERVMEIIATMSFGGGNRPPMQTLEGRVVQDADRLDAIGAVGVARAFAYGGSRGRALYNPDVAPQEYANKEQYRANSGTTINHFYEKLLLLKERMNTEYARRLAEQRHAYMLAFLDEFAAEWDGER
ncbi:MAG: HD domain protein [Ktedonobacterales bacterium]|jgi:uncharacterized protein|nr:MAG: HD domain protein [Ktedonobacterales bacterium]